MMPSFKKHRFIFNKSADFDFNFGKQTRTTHNRRQSLFAKASFLGGRVGGRGFQCSRRSRQ